MSSLPLELSQPGAGFRPDARFGAKFGGDLRPQRPDPAEGAFSDGYAKGMEDGIAAAKAEAEQQAAAREKIELGLARLAESDELRLEQKLREAVLVLCEQTLAPLATDPDKLDARISSAMHLLRRSEDERVLRLHPEDIVLLGDRLPEQVRVEPDPALERGELRVETAEGGVEDGPGQWRRALSEALAL